MLYVILHHVSNIKISELTYKQFKLDIHTNESVFPQSMDNLTEAIATFL